MSTLASLYQDQGKLKEALELFNQVLALKTNHEELKSTPIIKGMYLLLLIC